MPSFTIVERGCFFVGNNCYKGNKMEIYYEIKIIVEWIDLKGCKCVKKCKAKLYLRVMFGVTHKSRVKEILKKIKFYDLYPIFLFDFAKNYWHL